MFQKKDTNEISVEVTIEDYDESSKYDLDTIIYKLNDQLDLLSNKADGADYFVAIASGIACSMLDILWCGDFDLAKGREFASKQVDNFVIQIAQIYDPKQVKPTDIKTAVKSLENRFPVPNDANTADFGGGLQHHLRDFGHHSTIVGMIFSLLTQFTGYSYGTDASGKFCAIKVPQNSENLIGGTVSQKIINGTIVWFFHLVSDMAGSRCTAGHSGGTGIPGPILSMAKELSTLPFIQDICINEMTLSEFLSKMFNGTLWAKRDENGNLIKDSVVKLDFRGELGVGIELTQDSLPIIANECIVRSFYFLRHLAMEISMNSIKSSDDLHCINIKNIFPTNNPTLSRMLSISTGVFTTIDIGEAIAKQELVAVNIIGFGRFAVAVDADVCWGLKRRNIKRIKKMYQIIDQNTYRQSESNLYLKILNQITEGFGLTLRQTEILYNIEYYKTFNDINYNQPLVNKEQVKKLKLDWLNEWKNVITKNFSSFLNIEDAKIHWFSQYELKEELSKCDPEKQWFRIVMLEAMAFEPYFTMDLSKDKKGEIIPSNKYKSLQKPWNKFNQKKGDNFLSENYSDIYFEPGFIKCLRKSYKHYTGELNETFKKGLGIISIIALALCAILLANENYSYHTINKLLGTNFYGHHRRSLIQSYLAYIGSGIVSANNAKIVDDVVTISGGGAIFTDNVNENDLSSIENTRITEAQMFSQSVKLLVTLEQIFLNTQHNLEYVYEIYKLYEQKSEEYNIMIDELEQEGKNEKGEKKAKSKNKIKDMDRIQGITKITLSCMSNIIKSYENK